MKARVILGSLLLLAAAMFFAPPPAVAGDHDIDVNADLRTRFEYSDNFDDFHDDDGKSLDFTNYRLRLGLDFDLGDSLSTTVEVQSAGVWGNTFVQGAGDPVVDGGGNVPGKDETLLYQGFVDWKSVGGSRLGLRIGRQEHTLGNELHLGDSDFYNGTAFDGIRAMIDFEIADLDVFYYNIVEMDVVGPAGQLLPGTDPGGDDSILGGVTAKIGVTDGHAIEPYLFYSRSSSNAGATGDVYTLGALYAKPHDNAIFDWSLEAAYQTGDTTSCPGAGPDCDLESVIAEAWLGYAFGRVGQYRVHLGGLYLGAGDDAEDSEAFQALFTDTHPRAGALDLFSGASRSAIAGFSGADTFHNLTVYDAGYEWSSGPHSLSAAYLKFTATEDFGGEDDIGSEIDLIYELRSGDHLTLQLGAASFMPGDAFLDPANDDVLRLWAMLRVFTR